MTEHSSVHQSNYCYFICTYHNRYDGWCHYHSKDASEVDLTKCPKVLEMSKQSKSADEITIDLNELDIDISKEFILISTLKQYINSKIDYYEELLAKTDGYNHVSVAAHLDMLIQLKEWLNGEIE